MSNAEDMGPYETVDMSVEWLELEIDMKVRGLSETLLNDCLAMLTGKAAPEDRMIRAVLLTEYERRHGGAAFDAKCDELGL